MRPIVAPDGQFKAKEIDTPRIEVIPPMIIAIPIIFERRWVKVFAIAAGRERKAIIRIVEKYFFFNLVVCISLHIGMV